MRETVIVRFAVPNGSLQERTLDVLGRAGYLLSTRIGRDDFIGETEGVRFFLRDRENIADLVATGSFDAGITGADLKVNAGFVEEQSALRIVTDLSYGRNSNSATRWVLAAPVGLTLEKWRDMTNRRIGTERLELAKHCLKFVLREDDDLVILPGKEESAVGDGLCDAVFVVTETGSSLKAHSLEVLCDNLFVSTPQLLARDGLSEAELGVVEAIGLAMKAVLEAADMVTLTFDIPTEVLDDLELACAVSPTVSQTMDPLWLAGQVLIPRVQLGKTLLELRRAGARGVFMQEVQGYMS